MSQRNNIHIAYGSARGELHKARGIDYQDAIQCAIISNGVIAVIADGLGSKEFSKEAADAAVGAVLNYLRIKENELNRENADELLRYPLLDTARRAVEEISMSRPMDCNLAFLAIFGDKAYIGHMGDCAVCVLDDEPSARTTPGSSANSTTTVLTAVPDDLKIEVLPVNESLHGFILTTDGLEGVIYRKGSGWINKTAEDYYNPVAVIEDSGKANELLDAKVAALQREFGDSFDDDISIIVVSCDGQKVKLKQDPTWKCLCGKRNQINVPYCVSCKQDRLQIYPHNELMKEPGKPHLDKFVYELEQDPRREYAYLARAAQRLGLPLQHQPVKEPSKETEAEEMPDREPAHVSQPRSEGPDVGEEPRSGQTAKPYQPTLQQGDARRTNNVVNAHVGRNRENDKQTIPNPGKQPAVKKPKWIAVLTKVLIPVCAVLMAALMLLVGILIGKSQGGGSDYLGQTKGDKPHGIGVEFDGECIWASWYKNGEAVEEGVCIDSKGVMTADGEYVHFWKQENSSDGTEGTTAPEEESTAPTETSEPEETTEPIKTTEPTKSTDPEETTEYAKGTVFTVTQKLKRGRMEPQTNMTIQLDLNYNDKVKATGDPIQEVDGIRWIHIETEHGAYAWVDLSYLELD